MNSSRCLHRVLRSFRCRFSSSKQPSDEYLIKATQLWIHKVVIRLGLCPWAAKDVQNTQIRVFYETNPKNMVGLLAYKEVQVNLVNFAQELALDLPSCHSGMAILPQLTSFPQYLQFADEFNELLKTTSLESMIQIATFHPEYQFEDTEPEDAENWTSRSPYPTIHLLKVDEVSAALDAYPGPTDKIWERNIRVLKKLGGDVMMKTNQEILEEAKRECERAGKQEGDVSGEGRNQKTTCQRREEEFRRN